MKLLIHNQGGKYQYDAEMKRRGRGDGSSFTERRSEGERRGILASPPSCSGSLRRLDKKKRNRGKKSRKNQNRPLPRRIEQLAVPHLA